ncbi:MAG: hypothetical protein Q8O47_04580 [Candidatus Bathyarchaeota archaeon]|nr:hypothetical protein [Candidatus Bathyarchaeota archaeon]
MTDSSELQQIRDELFSLKLLYKRVAEDHIPSEKATVEDIESIESPDETVSKEEFLRLLDETPVKGRKSSVRSRR